MFAQVEEWVRGCVWGGGEGEVRGGGGVGRGVGDC